MTGPILVLDVDGVIIEGFPRKRWDADIEADFGIRPKLLQKQFFKPYWRDILIGRMPVEEPLGRFLSEHASHISVAEFLDYWHGRDAHLRDDVIEAALEWKSRTNGQLAIATNQDLTRANYLRNTLGLAAHVDHAIVSCEIGAVKPELAYFEKAESLIGATSESSIVFIDDLIDNVNSAIEHGWDARQVVNPDEALELIYSLNR